MIYLYNLLRMFLPNIGEFLGIIGAVLCIFGVLDAFLGYKLFKLMLGIIGFLGGAIIGFVVFYIGNGGNGNGDMLMGFIIIGGIIGSIIAETLHKIGTFLLAATAGFIVAFLVSQDAQTALVVGVLCGIAVVFIEKYVIIVATAMSGGFLTATGIWFVALSNGNNPSTQAIGWVIGIAGICFQLWFEKKTPKKADAETSEIQSGFIGKIQEIIENVDLKNISFSDVKSVLIKALLGLPIVIGIILGKIFGSFLLGVSITAFLYVFVLLQHIKYRKACVSPNEFAFKYKWEEWINKILDENIFIIFVPLIFVIYFYNLFDVFMPSEPSTVLAIVGTIGIYVLYFKALPSSTTNTSNITAASNIRYCTNCGAAITEGSMFCISCGTSVKDINPPTPGTEKKKSRKLLFGIVGAAVVVVNIIALSLSGGNGIGSRMVKGELTYNGTSLFTFFDMNLNEVEKILGPFEFNQYIEGGGKMAGYSRRVAFVYNDTGIILIRAIPELIKFNGVTLDKNRAGLIGILGEPSDEFWGAETGKYHLYYPVIDTTRAKNTHEPYSLGFDMSSPNDTANEVRISQP